MSKHLSIDPRVRKFLKRGLKHHRAGRGGPAEACYLRSLKVNPRCAPALHLLGLLAQQADQYQKSIHWMGESLALQPDDDDPDTLSSLAKAYLDQGQFQPAQRCYQRLAELLPQSAKVHLRLGTTLEWLGDWEAAAASYRRALDLHPDSPDIYGSLGRLKCKQGAFGEAVEFCRRALVLAPHRHEIYNLLGFALVNAGDYAAAVEVYRRALVLKSNSADTIFGLGYLLERQGDLASAAVSYQLVLKLDARLVDAHLHLGIIHFLQGNLGKAVECFARVQELAPDNTEVRTFLGHIHLLQGNFPLGWGEHEYRWKTAHFLRHRREYTQPLWKGEPLEGSRILLHAEQGLGDTLQFMRYAPLVEARGGNVILEVQPRLYRLLKLTTGAEEVIRRGDALPEIDWQCPLLSLPLAFATDLNSIPATIPYVHPDPALVGAWRQRMSGNSLRIGLVWGGSPTFPHERWRSIPLEQLAPLTNLEGTTFYSLQMGPSASQVKQLGPRVHLIDLQDEQQDLADTAAIVANLGLVISIDTSVAHLAGAMGKPVWVLLHKSPDWRWLLDREDSPWYPTARLFRQATLGNWQDVVARVERELREFVARTAAGA
ncbi:MAG: tetratricopeptide repeat protein [Terriglobia bacterium]